MTSTQRKMIKIKLLAHKDKFKYSVILVCFLLFTNSILASHFRYGDISYRVDNNDPTGRTIIFKVIVDGEVLGQNLST